MPRPTARQPSAHILLFICVALTWAIAPSARADGGLVRKLGDPALLQFKGCKAMSAENVRDQLKRDWEVEVAATPSAPLDEYLAALQRRVLAGYQACGFGNAKVDVATTPDASAVVINVDEGQRFLAGDIKITGTKTIETAVIIKELTAALPATSFPVQLNPSAGVITIGYWQQNAEKPKAVWEVGKPASFDPVSLRVLHRQVVEAFLRHGYFWLKCDATPVVVDNKAVLTINVVSEGRPAELDRIEIAGAKKNTATDITRYLKLEKGTIIDLAQMRAAQEKLWNSGRFMRHTVSAAIDRNKPGHCFVHLELEECVEAPPLNTPLSAAELTLLKTCDWLNKLQDNPDDQVVAVTSGDNDFRFVLGHDGVAMTLGPTKAATQPAIKSPASVVITPKEFGVVSTASHRKFVAHPLASVLTVSMNLVPIYNEQAGKSKMNFSMSGGFQTSNADGMPPFRLNIGAAPVTFVQAAHQQDATVQIKDGLLVVTSKDQVLRVDATTGRLVQLTDSTRSTSMTVTSGRGALADEIKNLEATAATNLCDPNHPIASFVPFISELLTSSNFLTAGASSAQQPALASAFQKILTPSLFAPLDELPTAPVVAPAERFRIPFNPEVVIGNGTLGQFAMIGVPYCNQLFVRNSWTWTLARESLNVLTGTNKYTNREVARLYSSDDIGPLGYLAGANLLTFADRDLARAFGKKGLDSLTVESFQKDCRVLFQSESIASRIVLQFIANVRQLNDEEAKALSTVLNPTVSEFVSAMAAKSKPAAEKPTPQATADFLKDLWEASLKPKVEAALKTIADAPQKPNGKP